MRRRSGTIPQKTSLSPFEEPPLYEEAVARYNLKFSKKITKSHAYKFAEGLQEIGWLDIEEDVEDRRKMRLRVLKRPENLGESRIPTISDISILLRIDFRTPSRRERRRSLGDLYPELMDRIRGAGKATA